MEMILIRVSVAIARLNLALRYPEASAEEIRAHISVGDYLNGDRIRTAEI